MTGINWEDIDAARDLLKHSILCAGEIEALTDNELDRFGTIAEPLKSRAESLNEIAKKAKARFKE